MAPPSYLPNRPPAPYSQCFVLEPMLDRTFEPVLATLRRFESYAARSRPKSRQKATTVSEGPPHEYVLLARLLIKKAEEGQARYEMQGIIQILCISAYVCVRLPSLTRMEVNATAYSGLVLALCDARFYSSC